MQPVEENISIRSPLLEPHIARNNDAEEITDILEEDLTGNLRQKGNPNPQQRTFSPSNYIESVGIDQGLGYFQTQNAWEGSDTEFFIPYYENQQAVAVTENQEVHLIPDQADQSNWPHELQAVYETLNHIAPEYGILSQEVTAEAVEEYTGWHNTSSLHLSNQVLQTLDTFLEEDETQYIQNFASQAYRKAAHPGKAMDRLNGSNVEQINGDGYGFTWNHYPDEDEVAIERLAELDSIYNKK